LPDFFPLSVISSHPDSRPTPFPCFPVEGQEHRLCLRALQLLCPFHSPPLRFQRYAYGAEVSPSRHRLSTSLLPAEKLKLPPCPEHFWAIADQVGFFSHGTSAWPFCGCCEICRQFRVEPWREFRSSNFAAARLPIVDGADYSEFEFRILPLNSPHFVFLDEIVPSRSSRYGYRPVL